MARKEFLFDRRLRLRFRRRLLTLFHYRLTRRLRRTRFLAARLMPLRLVLVMRMMMLLLRLTLRLDAAQRAAEFIKLALVGDFLSLGNFDEFEHFVQLIVQFLQRIGYEGRVLDGLADGGRFGGAEIRRLDPLALADGNARRRLRRALVTAKIPPVVATRIARLAGRLRRRCGFRGMFCHQFLLVRFNGRLVLVRMKTFRRFRMRLAKTAAGFSFVRFGGRVFSGFHRR
jgi:hypothetical protein